MEVTKKLKPLHFSLHSKKILLLSLIAVVFVMDLSIMQSDQNFQREANSFSTVKYIPQNPWVRKARAMVKGTPMAEMVPYLNDQNKDTAAYLVSVAKKESNWGKFSPRLNGQDCYNYWGYMGHTGNETPSGYTCFESPQEAIDVVGDRFSQLINQENLTTPQEMVVWKCGFDCSWDNPVAVKKWIHDVNHYYQKFYE